MATNGNGSITKWLAGTAAAIIVTAALTWIALAGDIKVNTSVNKSQTKQIDMMDAKLDGISVDVAKILAILDERAE